MSLSNFEYLRHILDETAYLMSESKGLAKSVFIGDKTLQKAFVRSIEIIGEATKKLPDEFKQQYPQIEWRAVAGMRDKLIHDYFGVDYDLVWDVVINKVPALHEEIKKIIKENV
jgi:uncharacterized protein with HEPN domain